MPKVHVSPHPPLESIFACDDQSALLNNFVTSENPPPGAWSHHASPQSALGKVSFPLVLTIRSCAPPITSPGRCCGRTDARAVRLNCPTPLPARLVYTTERSGGGMNVSVQPSTGIFPTPRSAMNSWTISAKRKPKTDRKSVV